MLNDNIVQRHLQSHTLFTFRFLASIHFWSNICRNVSILYKNQDMLCIKTARENISLYSSLCVTYEFNQTIINMRDSYSHSLKEFVTTFTERYLQISRSIRKKGGFW